MIILFTPYVWNTHGVECVQFGRIHGNADLARLGVDTEGALEEMVDPLADVHVQSGVAILEGDLGHQLTAPFGTPLQKRGWYHGIV